MIIIATSLSILSHENATRIIRFLSDAKPGENRARKFSSLRRRRERGFPIREAGSFERDRFQQLHPASVRRKRMDSPCRGHIGDLGHGEYFCQRFHLDSNVTSQPLPFPPPAPELVLSRSRWRILYARLRSPFAYKFSRVLDLSFESFLLSPREREDG